MELDDEVRDFLGSLFNAVYGCRGPVECNIFLNNVLDLTEMLVSQKPVFTTRGLIDGHVIDEGLDALSDIMPEVHSCYRKPWRNRTTTAAIKRWPDEMLNHLDSDIVEIGYFHRDLALASKLDKIEAKDGFISARQEAHLLHYPLCCVQAYHARELQYVRAIPVAYRAAAADRNCAIEELIISEAELRQTPALLQVWDNGRIAPFSSFALCEQCAADPASQGRAFIASRKALAKQFVPPEILETWEDLIAQLHEWTDDLTDFLWGRDVASVIVHP